MPKLTAAYRSVYTSPMIEITRVCKRVTRRGPPPGGRVLTGHQAATEQQGALRQQCHRVDCYNNASALSSGQAPRPAQRHGCFRTIPVQEMSHRRRKERCSAGERHSAPSFAQPPFAPTCDPRPAIVAVGNNASAWRVPPSCPPPAHWLPPPRLAGNANA